MHPHRPAVGAAPFVSSVDVASDAFKSNALQMTSLCETLRKRVATAQREGSDASIDKHRKRGQILGRERVALILDEGSPFLELGLFTGFGNKATPRTGICGIGLIHGREVLVLADSPTVRGAAKNEASVTAGLRALQISIENRLPVVNLIQTAGADLTQQDKVFHHGGNTFRLLAVRARMGLPTVSIVFGSSTAGGAYHPGMSDFVIMVKRHAKVYLGGPPLVKMATGEVVGHEVLGGAQMHSTVSGVADYVADNEHHAIRIARDIVATLDRSSADANKMAAAPQDDAADEPVYPASDLLGIVSPEVKLPFDMHEVIARVVDGSRMQLFKPDYGKTLVACWGTIYGFRVGILANNGVLFSDSSQKGAQFIALCNQSKTPILFFHNITGFMVGTTSEQGGLIKHGSLLVNAVSNSKVPHISVIMGASFGAGNYAMCGRAYHPRFLFQYPNAKCSVMGPDQLAGVMSQVADDKIATARTRLAAAVKSGKVPEEMAAEMKQRIDSMAADSAKQTATFKGRVEAAMDAYATSAQGLDDGIIDPRDTRLVLGLALSVVHNAPVEGGIIGGVSRL